MLVNMMAMFNGIYINIVSYIIGLKILGFPNTNISLPYKKVKSIVDSEQNKNATNCRTLIQNIKAS